MRRGAAIAAAVVAAVVVATLGYGYWHNATHGSLSVSVLDVTDRERVRSISDGALDLLDADGRVLAKVAAISPGGTFLLSEPASHACHVVERQAPFSTTAYEGWHRCFARQSRWLVTWIRKVRYAEGEAGGCRVQRVPIEVREAADDWWLWWMPLPHAGGKPYTSFSVDLRLDRARCRR